MHAALLFGRGNALYAVHATFVLHLGIDALAFDDGDDFLQAADRRLRRRQHFDLPALGFGVAVVHAEHFVGEERGFVAAGAGADFEDNVFLVVRIFGKQQDFQVFFGLRDARFETDQFFLGVGAHVGIFFVGEKGSAFGDAAL